MRSDIRSSLFRSPFAQDLDLCEGMTGPGRQLEAHVCAMRSAYCHAGKVGARAKADVALAVLRRHRYGEEGRAPYVVVDVSLCV